MSSHGSEDLFKHLIRELFQGEAGGVASLKIIKKIISKIINPLVNIICWWGRFAQNYKKMNSKNYKNCY